MVLDTSPAQTFNRGRVGGFLVSGHGRALHEGSGCSPPALVAGHMARGWRQCHRSLHLDGNCCSAHLGGCLYDFHLQGQQTSGRRSRDQEPRSGTAKRDGKRDGKRCAWNGRRGWTKFKTGHRRTGPRRQVLATAPAMTTRGSKGALCFPRT